jgi:hypothetical protein
MARHRVAEGHPWAGVVEVVEWADRHLQAASTLLEAVARDRRQDAVIILLDVAEDLQLNGTEAQTLVVS